MRSLFCFIEIVLMFSRLYMKKASEKLRSFFISISELLISLMFFAFCKPFGDWFEQCFVFFCIKQL